MEIVEVFTEINPTPQLSGFVANGVPLGIASGLRKKMIDDSKSEVTLSISNLMQFNSKV